MQTKRDKKKERERERRQMPESLLQHQQTQHRYTLRICILTTVHHCSVQYVKCRAYFSHVILIRAIFLLFTTAALQNCALTLSLCKPGHWGLGPHILLDRSCRKNALPLWEIKQPAKSNWSLGGTEHQLQHPPKTTHLETADRIQQNRIK